MTGILIVDDHPLVSDGIRTMLAGEDSMCVIGQCKSGEETMKFLEQETPDVILLDINLPGEDGLKLCERIRLKDQTVRIIGLASSDEAGIITGLLRRGGNGYLLKTVDRKELIKAVHAVNAGKIYLSHEANEKVIEQFRPEDIASQPQPLITRREKQILTLLADGMKGPQIADHLHLSPFTVETHRKNLFRKFNANSVQMMLKIAREKGLL